MPALRFFVLPVLTALLSGGCLYYESPAKGASDGTEDMRRLRDLTASTTPAEAVALMSDKTWRRLQGSSGEAVHYSTQDGRDFLWLHGQTKIYRGQWKVETGPDGTGQPRTRLCFRYPDDAINPLSNTPGDQWHCWTAGMVFHFVRERVEGDPLDLAHRSQAPFVLDLRPYTISQLRARLPR